MAKRKTQAKTVEKSPCDLANEELKQKGYNLVMDMDKFMKLKEGYEFTYNGSITPMQSREFFTNLNELRLELGINKMHLPNCTTCSFRVNEEKFKSALKPIYDICMKYYMMKIKID